MGTSILREGVRVLAQEVREIEVSQHLGAEGPIGIGDAA
jgi:hypothetical protein